MLSNAHTHTHTLTLAGILLCLLLFEGVQMGRTKARGDKWRGVDGARMRHREQQRERRWEKRKTSNAARLRAEKKKKHKGKKDLRQKSENTAVFSVSNGNGDEISVGSIPHAPPRRCATDADAPRDISQKLNRHLLKKKKKPLAW